MISGRHQQSSSISRRSRRGFAAARLTLSAAIFFAAGAVLIAAPAVLTGCKKKEAPTPAPPPPPPPQPKPVEIDGVMQSMKADARVQFPQAKAPISEDLARAVIAFSDALAKGDAAKLQPMLDSTSKNVLEQLRASGDWDESVSKIQAVRVVQLAGSEAGGMLSLAVQEPGSAYVLNWAIAGAGGKFVFSGMPASSQILTRASDWDTANVMPSAAGAAMPKVDMPALDGEAPPVEDAQPAPDEPERDPRRRNTPHGPVTVPGGS